MIFVGFISCSSRERERSKVPIGRRAYRLSLHTLERTELGSQAPTITLGTKRGSEAGQAEPRFQHRGGRPPIGLRRHRGGAVGYSQSLRYGRISAGHWGSVREVRPAEDLGLSGSRSASEAGRWILVREAQRPSSPLKVRIAGLCRAWREEEAQSNRCDLKALRARGRSSQGPRDWNP